MVDKYIIRNRQGDRPQPSVSVQPKDARTIAKVILAHTGQSPAVNNDCSCYCECCSSSLDTLPFAFFMLDEAMHAVPQDQRDELIDQLFVEHIQAAITQRTGWLGKQYKPFNDRAFEQDHVSWPVLAEWWALFTEYVSLHLCAVAKGGPDFLKERRQRAMGGLYIMLAEILDGSTNQRRCSLCSGS